jgi:hypothetical protein
VSIIGGARLGQELDPVGENASEFVAQGVGRRRVYRSQHQQREGPVVEAKPLLATLVFGDAGEFLHGESAQGVDALAVHCFGRGHTRLLGFVQSPYGVGGRPRVRLVLVPPAPAAVLQLHARQSLQALLGDFGEFALGFGVHRRTELL